MSRWEILGAGIALLAGLWGQAKRLVDWIGGLLVITVMLDLKLAYAVAEHLERSSSRLSKSRQRLISGTWWWVKPLNRFAGIAYESILGSTRTFWVGRYPVWFALITDKPISPEHPCVFTFFRGTIDWDALVSQIAMSPTSSLSPVSHEHSVTYHFGTSMGVDLVTQRLNETAGSGVLKSLKSAELSYSFRPLKWKPGDLGKDPLPTGLDGLALTTELRSIAMEMQRWHDLEGWYATRRIAWRRGYLFEGAAGTGKTAFARAVSEDLRLPMHVFDLASMSNKDLRETWAKMLRSVPCMVILEDLDSVFHGRTNVCPQGGMMSSGGLTFDALLNCVDGVERANGVLLIITTNHPELIDPALANRPGRIDRTVSFGPLDLEGRLKLARRIIGDEARSSQIAVDSGPVPASRFVEICCRVALGDMYKDESDPYRTPSESRS